MNLLNSSASRRLAPRWNAKPAAPIRYGLSGRLADALHGHLDGRRKLPLVPAKPESGPPIDAGKLSTPRLEVLRRLTGERIAQEHVDARIDVTPLLVEALPDSLGRVETAQLLLADARRRHQLASAVPTEHQLAERRLAEDHHKRPEALVTARRLAEHERREAAAREELELVARQLEVAQKQKRAVEAMVEARMDTARSRALRLHEHGWRRCATYWQQLVRSHPEGGRLNGLFELAGPDLPAWVTDPAYELDAAGARNGGTE